MKTKIRRWGNSLGVRIPQALAQGAELRDGSVVEIEGSPDMITLKPMRRKVSLRELMEKVSRNNLHGESDLGPARGRESW